MSDGAIAVNDGASDLAWERTRQRYAVLKIFSVGVVATGILLASTLVLPGIERMVATVAGKETTFNAAINITIALTCTLALTMTGMAFWVRSLKDQLRIQRQTISRLQRKLEGRSHPKKIGAE